MKKLLIFSFILVVSLTNYNCKFTKKVYNSSASALDKVNVFGIEDDIKLGKQVKEEIEADKKQFPILDERKNRELYRYVRGLRDVILKTNKLNYKDKFAWEIKLIDDKKTLNAFATPGGYIYVYTGLIKFLDSEDQLLGVLGHEMAHADRRHSTRQLTKSLGVTVLLSAILKDQTAIEQVVGGIINLKFSRGHEAEADEYSVKYLCPTAYNAAGSAGFFKKMMNNPSPPEFLSTHPSSNSRVKDIESLKTKLGCKGTRTNQSKYSRIKRLIK